LEPQRGWHPQPIIAVGIRKYRRKNFGLKTRFYIILIQIKNLLNKKFLWGSRGRFLQKKPPGRRRQSGGGFRKLTVVFVREIS
jgi:hypothetical protein